LAHCQRKKVELARHSQLTKHENVNSVKCEAGQSKKQFFVISSCAGPLGGLGWTREGINWYHGVKIPKFLGQLLNNTHVGSLDKSRVSESKFNIPQSSLKKVKVLM
jgi:hypothetical protein